MSKVDVTFGNDMWDPTKGGRSEFSDGVYQLKGTNVEEVTNPSSGKTRYMVTGEIVQPKEFAGQPMEAAIYGDMTKPANVKKLKTALVSGGVPLKNLSGNRSFDDFVAFLTKVFVGKGYTLVVKNAPEGEMVEYNGKLVRPFADVDFITKEQAAEYVKSKKAAPAAKKASAPVAAQKNGAEAGGDIASMMPPDGDASGDMEDIFKDA